MEALTRGRQDHPRAGGEAVEIPGRLVGAVVGGEGEANIRSVAAESGAELCVDKDGGRVFISGTKESVRRGVARREWHRKLFCFVC